MSSIQIQTNAAGAGVFTLASPGTATSRILTLPDATDTLAGIAATQTLTNKTLSTGLVMGASAITSGTVVTPTSGTSVTFTGIPSWAKRVTIMMTNLTYSTTVGMNFQIGSGSLTTTGYTSSGAVITTGGGVNATNGTGTGIQTHGPYTGPISGQFVLTLVNPATNLWVGTGMNTYTGTIAVGYTSGYIALAGALDRVSINTTAGTATISAGSINILYE